ncbi:hypothetical protein HK096_007674 [Nowakowskiella sp. JEL0078]|nr:hypothetical protein HK096_007674 [Nowakowskiella sp. JEL0078]
MQPTMGITNPGKWLSIDTEHFLRQLEAETDGPRDKLVQKEGKVVISFKLNFCKLLEANPGCYHEVMAVRVNFDI